MRPLRNTYVVIASEAKQSRNLVAFKEIATSLTLLAMTKNNYAKGLEYRDKV